MAPPTGEKASHASRGCVGVAKLRQHQHSLIASLRSGYVSNSNPFKVFIRSRPCAARPEGDQRQPDRANSAETRLRKIPGSRPSA